MRGWEKKFPSSYCFRSDFWRGRHFSASGLSDFGNFLEDSFLALFSASGLSDFGAGAIFQLLVLAIFGDFLEDLFLPTQSHIPACEIRCASW